MKGGEPILLGQNNPGTADVLAKAKKKSRMQITGICDGEDVKNILDKELEAATMQHKLKPYEIMNLKKDLREKSIRQGVTVQKACSVVTNHVASSLKAILKKRNESKHSSPGKKRRGSQNSSPGKKRRGSQNSRSPGGKRCDPKQHDNVLKKLREDLKYSFDEEENEMKAHAIKNPAGSCRTVMISRFAVLKPKKFIKLYNQLDKNSSKRLIFEKLYNEIVEKSNKKCLTYNTVLDFEKDRFCVLSQNTGVIKKLNVLKDELQKKIEKDAGVVAERQRQESQKKNKDKARMERVKHNKKTRECVLEIKKLDKRSALKSNVKGKAALDLKDLNNQLQKQLGELTKKCDGHKMPTTGQKTYQTTKMMARTTIQQQAINIKEAEEEIKKGIAATALEGKKKAAAAEEEKKAAAAEAKAEEEKKKAAAAEAKAEEEKKKAAEEAATKAAKAEAEQKKALAEVAAKAEQKKALAEVAAKAEQKKALAAVAAKADAEAQVEKKKKEVLKKKLAAEKVKSDLIAAAAAEEINKVEKKKKADEVKQAAEKMEADRKKAHNKTMALLTAREKKIEDDEKTEKLQNEKEKSKEIAKKEVSKNLVASKMKDLANKSKIKKQQEKMEEIRAAKVELDNMVKKLKEEIAKVNNTNLEDRLKRFEKTKKVYDALF
jgi:hypothetical protein